MLGAAIVVGLVVGVAQSADEGSGAGGVVFLVVLAAVVYWWFRRGRPNTAPASAQDKRAAAVAEFRRELDEDGIEPVCLASVEALIPAAVDGDASETWDFRVLALGKGQLMCSVEGPGYESTSLSSIEVTRFESNVLHLRTAGQSVVQYRSGPPLEGGGRSLSACTSVATGAGGRWCAC